jgi:phosphoribosylamine--glycine ligase
MNVLIVGGGGREHALAWKAAQSPRVNHVYVAPGNAGTALEAKVSNVAIAAADIAALTAFATAHSISLTIVGPEAPLVNGIVDEFESRDLRCLGPSAAAAQLEGSKSFAKAFLERHRIPTAKAATFSDFDKARRYIRSEGAPIVVKADGLAAGKGVVVATSVGDAVDAARAMLIDCCFADAGRTIVVETFLAGEEASFMCIVDGEHALPLASSQDHKARDNGDRGPNTGGMGAYSPAPVMTDAVYERVMNTVIKPTIRGLSADGLPYRGFLYAGLMIDADGQPRVLEFNCRFGDPETQPVMMRLQSDLVTLCEAALDSELERVRVQWDSRTALGVVMAAGGYPAAYATGKVIEGLDTIADWRESGVKVFHAGSERRDGTLVTSGGRVLCVTALGDDTAGAQRRAYAAVNNISWPSCYFRTDIGYRAVNRQE